MTMQVVKNTVVTLDYSVTDPDGELVDAGPHDVAGRGAQGDAVQVDVGR